MTPAGDPDEPPGREPPEGASPQTPGAPAPVAPPRTVLPFGLGAPEAPPRTVLPAGFGQASAEAPRRAAPASPPEAGPALAPPEPAAPAPAPPPRSPREDPRLAALAADPSDWDVFAAAMLVGAVHRDAPGPGRAGRIEDEPIRFGQDPVRSLHGSPLRSAGWTRRGGREVFELRQSAFGALGPDGPLPAHVTEDAIQELREGRPWLVGFLDVFTHRLTMLLVRAWQSARIAPSRALGRDDPWPAWIASLYGAGPAALRDRDAMPDDLKRYASGWLAWGRRSVPALEGVMGLACDAPVEVLEHSPEWLPMQPADQTRLGVAATTLGGEATLGPRFFSVEGKVRVRTRPMSLAAYRALLPGGARHAVARDAARAVLGLGRAWELNLVLKREETPPPVLDGGLRLGWETWLASPARSADPDDLVLQGETPAMRADATTALG